MRSRRCPPWISADKVCHYHDNMGHDGTMSVLRVTESVRMAAGWMPYPRNVGPDASHQRAHLISKKPCLLQLLTLLQPSIPVPAAVGRNLVGIDRRRDTDASSESLPPSIFPLRTAFAMSPSLMPSFPRQEDNGVRFWSRSTVQIAIARGNSRIEAPC